MSEFKTRLDDGRAIYVSEEPDADGVHGAVFKHSEEPIKVYWDGRKWKLCHIEREEHDMQERNRGWFADIDPEKDTGEYSYRWQPCFETGTGHVPGFDMWFWNKDGCEQWIEDNIIGAGWLPDHQ